MSSAAESTAQGLQVDDRDVSVAAFVSTASGYYDSNFERIQKRTLPRWHINPWALLAPWAWAAWRGVWLMFWLALFIDIVAVVCLMQVVKFSPLLTEAMVDASSNTTLIDRYSRWITNFSWFGWVILIAGRFWMGTLANRQYYRQYSRWRIEESVPSGVNAQRLVLGLVIVAICAPITFYRATQLRLDERACFNQIRTAEDTLKLAETYGMSDLPTLIAQISTKRDAVQAEFDALKALSDPTSEQKSAAAKLRKEARGLGRDVDLLVRQAATTARDRLDCFFIDDFPTIARIDPPEDAIYRRVENDAGEVEILKQVKDPVEGRKVNLFTYSAESIDISINFLRANYATFFDATTNVLRQSLIRVEVAFMQTPWIVVAFLFLVLSWAFTGRGTTVFVAASLGFLAVFELWQIAMQTMALVVVSTAICVMVGLPVGIWMAKNKYFRWFTEPVLDVMQTIPSLSYLVPAVAFFGISQPPAVLATVVFAMPPMIKLTALGILQVPESTREAALAFGATDRQLLRKVELPMAIPSIMAGLNQTIMLALSMATISAFIGAEGLGFLVTDALGNAQAGKGLLAGIGIALIAMMVDRILKGIRNSFSRI